MGFSCLDKADRLLLHLTKECLQGIDMSMMSTDSPNCVSQFAERNVPKERHMLVSYRLKAFEFRPVFIVLLPPLFCTSVQGKWNLGLYLCVRAETGSRGLIPSWPFLAPLLNLVLHCLRLRYSSLQLQCFDLQQVRPLLCWSPTVAVKSGICPAHHRCR